MCSLLSSRLENSVRLHVLSSLSLLDVGTKGATIINLLLFSTIESTPGLVLLCSFCISAPFSPTPSQSRQMAAHTEPGSAGGFFLLKGSFPFHCRYMHAQYMKDCCKVNASDCLLSTCSSRSECCKSLTRCNLLGFLR
ncbi:hypothetical protein AMECASPLE_033150 [Ameca splendens]|uniref:Uncharacterized protein n=1 Tax=Ameca splendens TaxID=208324 RepID=A0ABV0XJR3_9TELE